MDNLPELIGTEKQVEWANRLRPKMVAFIDAQIASLPTWPDAASMADELGISKEEVIAHAKDVLTKWRNNNKASFWIDRRNDYNRYLSAFEAGLTLFY